MKYRVTGNKRAPILVVCDAPRQDADAPISGDAFQLFREEVAKFGFAKEDFCFVSPCPPIPVTVEGSDAREKKFLDAARPDFLASIEGLEPRVIVTLGKQAARQVAQKAVKITRVRGKVQTFPGTPLPVLPLLSPYHVLRRPEVKDIFTSDIHMLKLLKDADWNTEEAGEVDETHYEWCTDLTPLLEAIDRGEVPLLSVDTEGTGLRWYMPDVYALTVQFSWREGHALVCPLDRRYYPGITGRQLQRLKGQIKYVLENPNVQKCGQNIKYDHHILRKAGFDVQGWAYDAQLLCFLVDENMQDKSQDEMVRRWVPAMAGYADAFNAEGWHSHMWDCPHDKMLSYGGGDADALLRLIHVLLPLATGDKRNWNCYRKVILPAMDAFMSVIEPEGMTVDRNNLTNLQASLDVMEETEYNELIAEVPPKVRRRHMEGYKPSELRTRLSFSRPDFTRDVLFSKDGFKLKPRVWTESTKRLPDDEKIPSTSAKDHLPYFEDVPFVNKLMAYQRLSKLRNTYVGHPETDTEAATGFWQYIFGDKIHPSFLLHATVTGRTSSRDPNAQNFPKRARSKSLKEVVKAFRRTFVAPEGWTLIEADLSQIELRLAAWEAMDQTMLDLYNSGADLHAATAAKTMGISLERFNRLDDDTRGFRRFQAKAVNFGFIYGLWWKNFITYAYVEYGIKLTEEQAQTMRNDFFELYSRLEEWHERKREAVRENGYVRSLHGAVRHLPSIYSDNDFIQGEVERQAINSTIQRFASDMGVMALSRLSRDCPLEVIRPLAFIHDALIVMARNDYLDEAKGAVKFYMESNPLYNWFKLRPPLPIVADVSSGINLADMEEHKGWEAYRPSWYQPELDR